MWEPLKRQMLLLDKSARIVRMDAGFGSGKTGKTEALIMYPFYNNLEGTGLMITNNPYSFTRNILERLLRQGLTIDRSMNRARNDNFSLFVDTEFNRDRHSALRLDYIAVDQCNRTSEMNLQYLSTKLNENGRMRLVSASNFYKECIFV